MPFPVRLMFSVSLGLAPLCAQEAAPAATVPSQESQTPTAAAAPPTPAQVPAPATLGTQPIEFKVLDGGLLEQAWFGVAIDFRREKEIDFLWMKPGFNFSGRQIRLKTWEPPIMLIKERDEKDAQRAKELTYLFPIVLRSCLNNVLAGKVKFSSTEGELTLVGRFVSVNAGSDNAKFFVGFGAGSATATWDLKIVDTTTNELLLALHHRCISGSAFSGIQDKLEKWSRKFAQYLNETAFH